MGFEIRKIPLDGSTDDIFRTKVDGSRPTHILLLGAAGYGKTTTLAKLAHDWAQKEDSPLAEFLFVFLLQFRGTHQDISLGEVICTQLLYDLIAVTPAGIEQFIRANANHCGFLLDGYDEFSGTIACKGAKSTFVKLAACEDFPGSRVLVTTRHYRQEEFQTGDMAREYATMELEGYSTDNSEKYIANFFCENPSEGTELISYLHKQYTIGSLINIPFFCMTLCCLWQERYLQGTASLTNLFEKLLLYLVQHAKSRDDIRDNLKDFTADGVRSLTASVGKVALKSLIDSRKNLIINKQDFEDCLQELDICVQIGLVSEENVPSDHLSHIIEFFHKLAHEYCAGVYLASLNSEKLGSVLSILDNREKVMDLDNVLQFAAGSPGDVIVPIIKRINKSWGIRSFLGIQFGEEGDSDSHRILLHILSESLDYESVHSSLLRQHFKDRRILLKRANGTTFQGLYRLPNKIKTMVNA